MIPFKEVKWNFVLAFPALIKGQQVWKILTSKLLFTQLQGIVSGCLLIYYFRVLERRFGSRNYANFLLWSAFGSFLVEALIFGLVKDSSFVDLPFLSSGPYSVVYSCLIQFALDVPFAPYGYIFHIPMSTKLLPYILAAQLPFLSVPTFISCLSGAIVGCLYRTRIFDTKKLCLIPAKLSQFCNWAFNHVCEIGEDKTGRILPIGATLEAQRAEAMDRIEQRLIFEQMRMQNSRDGNSGVPFVRRLFGAETVELQPVEVSEANIQVLVDMGFTDRNAVVRALQGCNNDVSSAANFLLHSAGGQ